MYAAGARHDDVRVQKEGRTRVSIILDEPLSTQVRGLASRRGRQLATMLREWITERTEQELKDGK